MKSTKYELASEATTKVVSAEPFQREVYIHTASGSSYVGAATVTTGTGLHLPNGDTLTVTVAANETLYAISNTTATLIVLESGTVD